MLPEEAGEGTFLTTVGGRARGNTRRYCHRISMSLSFWDLSLQVSKMKLRPGLVFGTLPESISLTCMANSQGTTIKQINGGPQAGRGFRAERRRLRRRCNGRSRGKPTPNTEGISQSFSDMGTFFIQRIFHPTPRRCPLVPRTPQRNI